MFKDTLSRALLPIIITCVTILALMPFSFFLIVSLSPTMIKSINLARVEGKFIDPSTNGTVEVRITVGPAGGCMYYNHSEPKCSPKIPYIPDPDFLHLPPNSNVTSAFPVAMGRALALNHIIVIFTGISLIAALLDIFIFKGGVSLVIIYFTMFIMWIFYFFESTYIGLLNKRLENIYEHDQWDCHTGNGFIMITVAVFVASIFICGGVDGG